MSRLFVLPYKMTSESAKLLANKFGCKRLRVKNSKYKSRRGDIVINFGHSSDTEFVNNTIYINPPIYISYVCNKITFFKQCYTKKNSSVLPFTTNKSIAKGWITKGHTVYCRTKVDSSKGKGIIIARTHDELVDAPLYTRGIPKAREYRAHIIRGQGVFLLQQKKRRNGGNGLSEIKNHDNGWVYATENITPPPEGYKKICETVLQRTGLDFLAIDFLVKDGRIWVVEANSAPGLVGPTTLNTYHKAISKYIKDNYGE